jgi:hypothetical protein
MADDGEAVKRQVGAADQRDQPTRRSGFVTSDFDTIRVSEQRLQEEQPDGVTLDDDTLANDTLDDDLDTSAETSSTGACTGSQFTTASRGT